MTRRDESQPRPGDSLKLKEADYKFGLGDLTAQISQVLSLEKFDAEPWWRVRALCRRAATDRGAERELYVRAQAVAAARRAAGMASP